jgi:hypothetical protein
VPEAEHAVPGGRGPAGGQLEPLKRAFARQAL